MSDTFCQGPKCHTYKTKDRIRGHKGDKHYETRKNRVYYHGNFCSLRCQDDWFKKFGTLAIDHFGRLNEAKRTTAEDAWYKEYGWRNGNHYFVNNLLGKKIPITQAQYNDDNFTAITLGLVAT